ncbi:MAG: hypothetical protein ABI600_03485 [Luteolibacter sp.]
MKNPGPGLNPLGRDCIGTKGEVKSETIQFVSPLSKLPLLTSVRGPTPDVFASADDVKKMPNIPKTNRKTIRQELSTPTLSEVGHSSEGEIIFHLCKFTHMVNWKYFRINAENCPSSLTRQIGHLLALIEGFAFVQ